MSLAERTISPRPVLHGPSPLRAVPGAALRGAQVSGSRTTTSALRGAIRDDPRTRDEFLARCGLRA